MDILFLGNLFSEKVQKSLEKKHDKNTSFPSNIHQWLFIKGLFSNEIKYCKIVTSPAIGSFPLYSKRLIVKKDQFDYKNYHNNVSIRYCNLAIIKQRIIERKLFKEAKKWVHDIKNNDKEKVIIVYGTNNSHILAAIKIRKEFPKTKLCLIIPDLPEYSSNSTRLINRIRNKFIPSIYPYLSFFDAFVFLTDEMATACKLNNNQLWIRMEGIADPNDDLVFMHDKITRDDKKTIMYAGTLASRYGILFLLKAFQAITDPNYLLWICGEGNTEQEIKEAASLDSRIKFWGLLPREKVLQLERQATVVVNPRSSNGEYTKFSFPSKTIEYLLSETPCIMYKLPGIPEDYDPFIFYINGDEIDSLKNKILEVCNMKQEEIGSFCLKAKEFVLSKKNYTIQVKRMLDMIYKIT